MRAGLISDTHCPAMGAHPPPEVARAFEGVDLILHAGDVYTSECLDWLERIAPVLAVEIPPAPCVGDPRVGYKRVLDIGGRSLGLVHELIIIGHGFEVVPGVIERQVGADEPLGDYLETFFGERVETVVFGDTHVPMVERHQGILFINPGSTMLPWQRRQLGTVAILEADGDGAEAWIVDLSEYRE
ncbi:MAG: metallophosphoesterase family protein [Chloroflexi bacterium]|nr:metallophosphoesterase family protein [Chloroflexota bacterium]